MGIDRCSFLAIVPKFLAIVPKAQVLQNFQIAKNDANRSLQGFFYKPRILLTSAAAAFIPSSGLTSPK